MDSQGPDRGTQYRSAIFYHSPEQKETAEKVAEEIKSKHPQVMKRGGFLATEIVEAGKWYTAEAYHQQYLDVNKGGYTCPTHRLYVRRLLSNPRLIVLSQVVVTQAFLDEPTSCMEIFSTVRLLRAPCTDAAELCTAMVDRNIPLISDV